MDLTMPTPERHDTTGATSGLTRRRLLGRLALGAAATTVALALPAAAAAAPATPGPTVTAVTATPAWLGFEAAVTRLREASASLPAEDEAETLKPLTFVVESLANEPPRRWTAEEQQAREREHEAWREQRRLEEERRRMATVQVYGKLTPRERRRLRHWIAAKPPGEDWPTVRLQDGRLDREHEYLDVIPPRGSWFSAYDWATTVAHEAKRVTNRPFAYSLSCSHGGPAWG